MSRQSVSEKVGNVAFILMCLSVTIAAIHYVTTDTASLTPKPAAPVAKGTKVERLTNPNVRATLALVLSTTCRFCTESVPFYERLNGLEEVRSGRVAILVASIQPPDQMVKYLTTHRLNGFSVLQAVESGLQVSATPVVVLLDSSGNVLDSWAGLQSQSGESTIVAAIRRAAS